jgi:nitrate reductase NapD
MCISSLVVQAKPELLHQVRSDLENLPETEVVGHSEKGKLVVVLDTADNRRAADRITQIQNTAGVLSATLIYQYDDHHETQLEDSQ